MPPAKTKAKINIFDSIQEKARVGILMQRVPDPDGIGAALGVEWFLKKTRDITCDILYSGVISHPQTRALLNVLNIDLMHKDDFEKENYDLFIVVDSTIENTGFDIVPNYVIDHHKAKYARNIKALNRQVGATCTLVWELIKESKLQIDDQKVGTAMTLGIYTDTNGLRSATTELDYLAYQDLSTKVDKSDLSEIFNYPIPSFQFELQSRAIQHRIVDGPNLVTCLGDIMPTHRDSMPAIADSILRMSGIETVVVFAFIEGHIDASVRSNNSTLDVDEFCKSVFGAQFYGTAGSKGGVGGGRAPLGIALTDEDAEDHREKMTEILEETIRQRIIKKLAK